MKLLGPCSHPNGFTRVEITVPGNTETTTARSFHQCTICGEKSLIDTPLHSVDGRVPDGTISVRGPDGEFHPIGICTDVKFTTNFAREDKIDLSNISIGRIDASLIATYLDKALLASLLKKK